MSGMERKIQIRLCLLSTVLAALFLPGAHASVVYSTGFEPPTYTTGLLVGQDGWLESGSAITTVENFNVFAGSQALFLDSTTPGQSGPYHLDSPLGPLIYLSVEMNIAFGANPSEWQFAALDPSLTAILGGIDVFSDGSLHLISGGSPALGAFSYNTWHNVSFLFDMNSQQYAFWLDGTQLSSGTPFCGDNGSCGGANVPAYGATSFNVIGDVDHHDSAFLDNLVLADAPEPGTLLMLASGMAFLWWGRRLRTPTRQSAMR
jgi:PEP-CTERM motif